MGEPRSSDRRCSAEDDGERGILLGSLESGLVGDIALPRVPRRVGRAEREEYERQNLKWK